MLRLTEDLPADVLVDGTPITSFDLHLQFELTNPYAIEIFLIREGELLREQVLALELFTKALKFPDTPQGDGEIKVAYISEDEVINVELPNGNQGPFTLQCNVRTIYQFLACANQLTVVNGLKKQYRKRLSEALGSE